MCLVAMPLIGTGQQKIQDGGKQNGRILCYLKMTSFAEIARVLIAKKVLTSLGNTKEKLGNVLGEALKLSS